MKSLTTILFAGTLLGGCLLGCNPEKQSKRQYHYTSSEPEPAKPSPTLIEKVQERPAPAEASHQAQLIANLNQTGAAAESVESIRGRVQRLRNFLSEKEASEQKIIDKALRFRRDIQRAREECDAIVRIGNDLRTELRFSRSSFEHSADLYRNRARQTKDETLRSVVEKIADEFLAQADDVPRRIHLTDFFLDQLRDTQTFLSEAERVVQDVRVAIDILSAGRDPISVSPDARVNQKLNHFLDLVDDYCRQFFKSKNVVRQTESDPSPVSPPPNWSPPPKAAPMPKETPKVVPPPPSSYVVQPQMAKAKPQPEKAKPPMITVQTTRSTPQTAWYWVRNSRGEVLIWCPSCRAYHPYPQQTAMGSNWPCRSR